MKKIFFLIILVTSCAPKIVTNNLGESEELIYWNENTPLRKSDFRGSSEKRPFQAATSSGLKIENPVNIWTGKTRVIVRSYFNPKFSYFKYSERDSSVLAHEQLHFDITELYARKLRQQLVENCSNQYDYFEKRDAILKKIELELTLKQDEYDSEVYSERLLQSQWNKWVEKQLRFLRDFANEEIPLKYKFFAPTQVNGYNKTSYEKP